MPASNMISLVVDTDIAQDAENALMKEEWEQPTSPGPLYLKEDKDTLAYEHDRQKYKKTLDRAKSRAKKAFSWGNSGSGSPRRASHGQPAPERNIKAGEEDKELASEFFQVGNVQVQRRKNSVVCSGPGFTEVKLAELVVLAAAPDENGDQAKGATKKKRTRVGKGGLDGDYEVVPHLRSVIVLEDQHAPEMDLDDWECVEDESSDDGAEKKVLGKTTYATVAAAAAVETK
ncbi:hypothetical protein EST38_g1312 [Candolleomyces aberdarensis]|uniref:Uncharacterized protein n=1 Tax=Candolleomyces aberdarensis TaxID=2316362 RepID=A0A4Q2DYV3_9AGAR|nr:hypothetical protein EST38_g1312 [Candolleomyces aberdarensis]